MIMTPKEKASELYSKFSIMANSYIEGKKCALLAVDEMLNCETNVMVVQNQRKHFYYWEKVKDEIQNL